MKGAGATDNSGGRAPLLEMPIEAFIIEHLEPVVSKWVWIEYKHASEIAGRDKLVITNVKDPREREILSRIAREVSRVFK